MCYTIGAGAGTGFPRAKEDRPGFLTAGSIKRNNEQAFGNNKAIQGRKIARWLLTCYAFSGKLLKGVPILAEKLKIIPLGVFILFY